MTPPPTRSPENHCRPTEQEAGRPQACPGQKRPQEGQPVPAMITTTETSTGLLEETLEERRHPYRHSRLSERLRYPLEGSNPCPGTHPRAEA